MLEKFPKKRPSLNPQIQQIYSTHYKKNREGETTATSLSQKMERWLHLQVAKDVKDKELKQDFSTLEIGAGTLNQLDYEDVNGRYDVIEPFKDLFKDSPHKNKIKSFYSDINEIELIPTYDRITSIASLEHICNLPEVVARSGLLLKEGGTFRASIPSEGTILWTLGWKLTTGLEFRLKYGLDYGELMRHEHVNSADEIEWVLKKFFGKVSCRVFGLSKSLSFYRYYECSIPNRDLCKSFLL